MLWEKCYARRLVVMSFIRRVSSSCCVHHPTRKLMAVVHGDDFTVLGTKVNLDWFEVELATAVELKLRGRMGERQECVHGICGFHIFWYV